MRDREIILGLLRAVAARMRLSRVLQETGFAACVVLFTLAAFKLLQPRLGGVLAGFDQPVLIAGLCAFGAYIVYQALKRVQLSQAATLADSRLPLHDELKSAYWFASHDDKSAFVDAHIANAARTAKQLTGAGVMPVQLPRSIFVAGLLGMVLVGAMWGRSDLVQAGIRPGSPVMQAGSDAESARALLSATAADDEEIKRLDRALAVFERGDVSRSELQEAMVEARDAIDQVNMRASVAREGLAKLARAMRGHPGLEQVAQALEEGRTAEAAAMLRELRKDLPQLANAGDSALQSDTAPTENSEMDLQQAFGQSARDLAGMTGTINDDALNRIIENLEDAQSSMELQRRVNETRSRNGGLADMQMMNAQRGSLTAARFGDDGERPTATPSPFSGKSDLRGGTMFRQGAISRDNEDDPDDGSTTGASSGHSKALALEGRATRRLEAQLELERVRVGSGDDANAKGDESEWFYSASQQQSSDAEFEEIRANKDYARADVVNQGRIPIQQRQAVRDYFMNLHEGDK